MPTDNVYYSRKFLNKKRGTAVIECEVLGRERHGSSTMATVRISDCSRLISLDFSVYDKQAIQMTRKKWDTLLNELQAARDAWENAVS